MSDLISRQAAIDALKQHYWDSELQKAKDDPCVIDAMTDLDIRIIKALPSAQQEPSTDIQDVIRYLDDVLHPLISPNNWNVYYELHDMVSSLPSARPEVGLKEEYWIYLDDDELRYDSYRCSNCNRSITVDAERKDDIGFIIEDMRYCPNCGAKMVDPQESEEMTKK